MASDGEDFAPDTPSKKGRAASRQIMRWTDAKLAFAFAEFRMILARDRIDFKKQLDEAAKSVAPFVTGEAVIQQLAKRRARYLKELEDELTEVSPATPRRARQSAAPSPARSKKATSKRRKTDLEKEAEDLKDSISTDVIESVETPTTSAKRKGRAPAKKGPLSKIKSELASERPSPATPPTPSDDEDDDYTESSTKTKKKRVLRRKATTRVQSYAEMPSEDAIIEVAGAEEDEDEYVDETGGTVVMYDHSGEPSPTERKDSFETLASSNDDIFGHQGSRVEDVFMRNDGSTCVKLGQLLPSPRGFNGPLQFDGAGTGFGGMDYGHNGHGLVGPGMPGQFSLQHMYGNATAGQPASPGASLPNHHLQHQGLGQECDRASDGISSQLVSPDKSSCDSKEDASVSMVAPMILPTAPPMATSFTTLNDSFSSGASSFITPSFGMEYNQMYSLPPVGMQNNFDGVFIGFTNSGDYNSFDYTGGNGLVYNDTKDIEQQHNMHDMYSNSNNH